MIISFKLLFMLCIMYSFLSCEKDYEENKINQNNIKVKEYTFDQVNQKSIFNNSYLEVTQGIRNKISTSKSSENNPINFSIDSTTIKEITVGNKTTYTMFVVRDVQKTESFENFIVEVDNANNIRAFLIEYFPDTKTEHFHEHNSFILNGTKTVKQIEYDATIFQPLVQSTDCVSTLMCDYDHEHVAGANCTQTYLVIDCNKGGGGGFGGNGSGSGDTGSGGSGYGNGGTGSGNGSGGGGGSSDSDNTNPPNDPIVTAPVLEEELDTDTPCDKIKNSTTNSAAYKQKFKDLNTPAHFNDTMESGFGQVGNSFVNGIANNRGEIDYPDNSKNGTHVHNNDITYYPNTNIAYDKNIKMISPQDIRALMVMKDYNMTPTSVFTPEDTFHAMISNEGIFAITILEPINWDNDLENKINEFESYYYEKSRFIVNNYQDMTPTSRKKYLEKMFLLGLKEFNLDNFIGLFEGEVANENATNINDYEINWTKKTLKKVFFLGYNVEPTPCN